MINLRNKSKQGLGWYSILPFWMVMINTKYLECSTLVIYRMQ